MIIFQQPSVGGLRRSPNGAWGHPPELSHWHSFLVKGTWRNANKKNVLQKYEDHDRLPLFCDFHVCVCVCSGVLWGSFLSICYNLFLFCMDFSNVFFFDKNIEDLFENWVVHDFAKPMPGVGEWHQMLGPLFGARECHLNLNGYWEKGSDSKGGILRWCINVSWEGLCAYNKDAS